MTDIGLISIIRGVRPEEAADIGWALYEGGIRIVEVPLNSPDPFNSIRTLRDTLPPDCHVGAGTVLTVDDVARAADAGAQLIVSPNIAPRVVEATVARNLDSYPGCATPTEAFAAIAAGATRLKLFPSGAVGVDGMKAWRSVLPAGTSLIPVGGVGVLNLEEWVRGGAAGAGIGSWLYKPGDTPHRVRERALEVTFAWKSCLAAAKEATR